jgi:eukaryotic-like serine/threonine-protein kinase
MLVRRIAVGGMGEVWEAGDTLLHRRVAVKILKEEFRSASTFLARFRAEARHAGQLSHPGIATVYDYGETSELAFLVMELVDGHPLSELMVRQPALSATTKLSILSQASEALHAAHRAGVVHRDVKPSNLMVRHDGTVKVTDFGIARARTSAPLTEHGQMIGTPAYVSPEQAVGDQVTGASDVYSLGVVAYEMFAGSPPFERDTPLALTLAHVNDPPPPLPDTVPRHVAELIESMLAKDPSLRPPSAAHVAERMRREMAAIPSARTAVLRPPADRGPMPTIVTPSSQEAVALRVPTRLAPVTETDARPVEGFPQKVRTQRRRSRGHSGVLLAFAGLVALIGATIWAATQWNATDEARPEPSIPATLGASPVGTETSPPAEPPPVESPPVEPPPVESPPAPVPPAVESATPGVAESEAMAFVVQYYERVGAGDYATTWELLSPEFREARNLTFERYVSYWENTRIDIRDLRFVPGPGDDESRIVFEARYDTASRVVEETDEITLRRHPEGHLVITKQRTV